MSSLFRTQTLLGLVAAAALTTLMGCATVDKMTGSVTSAVRGDEKLTGAQEVPPVTTTASGTANIKVTADGSVSGSVNWSDSGVGWITTRLDFSVNEASP